PTVDEAEMHFREAGERMTRPLRLRALWLEQRRRAALALRTARVVASRALRRSSNHARARRRHRVTGRALQRGGGSRGDPPGDGGDPPAAAPSPSRTTRKTNITRDARARQAARA